MPRRRKSLDGYPHTTEMVRAYHTCQANHGQTLREYLLSWRDRSSDERIGELAAEFGVDRSTFYDWIKLLGLDTRLYIVELSPEPVAA